MSLALVTTALTSKMLNVGSANASGTLIWGMPAETDTLAPHATGGWSTYKIFEGL